MHRLNWVEKLVVVMMLFFDSSYALAQKLPGDSERLLPTLDSEISTYWPTLAPRSFIAGVIDQESNWKVNAKLKTERELGCGLGQFTIAYSANGAVRFDALGETKALDRSLANWDWRDCSNAQFQMRAVVLKLKVNERSCATLMRGNNNVKACDAAQYNGGSGSVTKRIRYCRAIAGCEPTEWFGHLDKQCPQSQTKVAGYGESFCDINSKYPGRVFNRMPKFKGIWPNDVMPQVPK